MIRALLVIGLVPFVIAAAPTTKPGKKMPTPLKLTINGRAEHPIVNLTKADIARARANRDTYWGKPIAEKLIKDADVWMARSDPEIKALIPAPGACFAYGFSSCPLCNGINSWWGAVGCTFDDPGHVRCPNGHRMPDAEHPDPGTGWRDKTGKIYYFVGTYNSFVSEQLLTALNKLTDAFALTGDEKYARRAALILDELARIYPACDKGSWDYPSDPPSGRFNRPWYQVARTLISYAHHYDVLMSTRLLDTPSSVKGLTKRQNIETNLLLNGAEYCYLESVKEIWLSNGQADYIRGCMAVGAAMGIPEYVQHAVHSPTGYLMMLEDNIDRDGHYYETSSGYSHHTRYLYMNMAEILKNYSDAAHPDGFDWLKNPKFKAFYLLPQSRLNLFGHVATLGDDAPDLKVSHTDNPIDPTDISFLHHLTALAKDPKERAELKSLLEAGPSKLDADVWMLFHSDGPVVGRPATQPVAGPVHPITGAPIASSDLLTQKGVAVMRGRSGRGGFTLRFGPTLNHGHRDELNLNLYALDRQLSYDLGYGLGSTHTQVGWTSQTASHNTVLVDETSQLKTDGSGGSLIAFADLPEVQFVQADVPLCYSSQKVTRYERAVAMIPAGDELHYTFDVFRVAGGEQHDLSVHMISKDLAVDGAEISQPRPGSVAGEQFNWGNMQQTDGDMKGIANKPYWNPPPGNGLGFLVNPRDIAPKEGECFAATWKIADDANVRVTFLPSPGATYVAADAPGILPKQPRAAYVLARRKAADSTFASIIEPHHAAREIKSITPLDAEAGSVAVAVELNGGRVDYLLSHPDQTPRTHHEGKQFLALAGLFGAITGSNATLIRGTELTGPGISLKLEKPAHTGAIAALDFDKNILYTDTPLPEGRVLANQFLTINNPAYSRNSAYRIDSVRRDGSRAAIQLAPTTMILGRAHIDAAPTDPKTLPNIIPLEYAKTLGKHVSGYFAGKRVRSADGRTSATVKEIEGREGTTITTDGAGQFKAGDDLIIEDVKPGDSFEIACFATVNNGSYVANAPLKLTIRGKTSELPASAGALLDMP